jgi:hypothetical protein
MEKDEKAALMKRGEELVKELTEISRKLAEEPKETPKEPSLDEKRQIVAAWLHTFRSKMDHVVEKLEVAKQPELLTVVRTQVFPIAEAALAKFEGVPEPEVVEMWPEVKEALKDYMTTALMLSGAGAFLFSERTTFARAQFKDGEVIK